MQNLNITVSINTVSMASVKELAKELGSPFFDKSLLAVENTRTFHEAVKHGSKFYFITANRFPWEQVDGYTIRVMDSKGNIKVLGEVAGFKSYDRAFNRVVTSLSK
jgi:anaerobic ribonucleoside-triphosphate reductase